MLVCFTGGGTLGHIYPALAVHEVLLATKDYSALWIGRDTVREREAVEQAGIPFYPIQSGKYRRYRSWKNFTDIFRLIVAYFQALSILRRTRPDVLFSKGGFVSVPPVLAAKSLGIRILTHESDATAGLATRINSRFSDLVCVPFKGSEGRLPSKKVVVTGNPIRAGLFTDGDISRFSIPAGMPLLLVLGGSQGSFEINALVRGNLERLCSLAFVIHQCGEADYRPLEHKNYCPVPQLGVELGALYRRSSLVVSRGGAGAITELLAFGCASLIVPLSRESSRGDQVDNARHLVGMGAARALLGEVNGQTFLSEVEDLLENPAKRSILSGKAQELAVTGSASLIASLIRKGE